MPNSILHKRSSTAGVVPHAALLANGEIALNSADGTWFIKRTDGTVLDLRQPLITDGGSQPLAGINADAQDWQTRVIAAGGTVSASTFTAVNNFCNAIDAAGIRDRFYRLNLFCGGNLAAALVPLYRGPSFSGTQYGNSIDTNNNFVISDYTETGASGGLIGNTTTKYLNTGLAPNALPSVTTGHLSAWTRGGSVASTTRMIGTDAGTSATRFALDRRPTGAVGDLINWGSIATGTFSVGDDTAGLFSGSRSSLTAQRFYKNGSPAVPVDTQSATATAHNNPWFVFAINGNGTPGSYYQHRLAAYSIGAAMSDTQMSAYYAAVQIFQIALNRTPPTVSNADAQDWVNRVYTAGGEVSATTAAAVNTFCSAVESAGIRDRFYRLNLFCGSDLTACRVPLYRNWKVYAGRNLLLVGDNVTTWSQLGTTTTFSTTERPFATGPFASVVSATAATNVTPYVVTSANNFGYGTITVSVYLKANGQNTVRMLLAGSSGMTFPGGGSVGYANINLSTGAVSNVLSGTSATATSVGNGWWRFAYTAVNNGVGNMAVRFDLGGGSAYNPTGAESVFIWGVQSELGSTATEYEPYPVGNTIDTNNSFVVGDYVETGAPGGLSTSGTNTTKYLATGLDAFLAGIPYNNSHLSFYAGSVFTGNSGQPIGSFAGSSSYQFLQQNISNVSYHYYRSGGTNNSGVEGVTGNPLVGHQIGQRSSSGALYINGVNRNVTSTTSNAGTWSSSNKPAALFVFARQNNTTADQFYSGALQAYSAGLAFTDAQALAYSDAMLAFQIALNRRGPVVSNADAQDWIDRVYLAGGTVSQSTAAAVNTFCNSINATGLRDRFYRLNLFCGNDLTACRVPLYRGQSLGGTQFGNTTDTNNNFTASDYNERGSPGGLRGNASNKYLNTGVISDLFASDATGHLAYYAPQWTPTTTLNPGHAALGAQNSGGSAILYGRGSAPTCGGGGLAAHIGSIGTGGGTLCGEVGNDIGGGHTVISRTGSAGGQAALYRNGVLGVTSNSFTNTYVPANLPVYVFAFSFLLSGNVAVGGQSPIRMRGYSFGLSMTASQVAAYNNAMQAFQTALNRAV